MKFIDKSDNFLLFEGDAFEVMDKLIKLNFKFDAIITDPPYNIGIDKWDKNFNFVKVEKRINKLLKSDGNLILFAGWSFTPKLLKIFENYDLNNWIIWDRIKGRGAKRNVVSTREDILWFSKGKNYTYNYELAVSETLKKTGGSIGKKNGCKYRKLSNVWTDISPLVPWSRERKNNCHPSQKPLKLMERLVKLFSKEGDLILDFTSGTGSTLEACKNLKRRFVGIEVNKIYNRIACQRLKRSYEGFVKRIETSNKKKSWLKKNTKKWKKVETHLSF